MGVKAAKNAGTGYYFFLGGGTILQEGENGQLAEVQPYIPTVLVNGKGMQKMAKEADGGLNGVLYEGYNLLTGAFKCTFSTDGESLDFQLPQKHLDREYTDKKVYRVELQLKNSTVIYEASMKSSGATMLSDQLPVSPADIGLTESGYTDAYVQVMFQLASGRVFIHAGATKDGKEEGLCRTLCAIQQPDGDCVENQCRRPGEDLPHGTEHLVWRRPQRCGGRYAPFRMRQPGAPEPDALERCKQPAVLPGKQLCLHRRRRPGRDRPSASRGTCW